MRLSSSAALLLLFAALGCGGAGGHSSENSLNVTPESSWMTILPPATISFPDHMFPSTTTVTMRDFSPPQFTDQTFHAIQRPIRFTAPAVGQAFDVFYPDTRPFATPVAVALDGPQIIGTLPIIRQDGQVGIHIDPATIPPNGGNLDVTICLGEYSP